MESNPTHNLPLVSIIIPVYNGADYMREAVDSALAQTYEKIEIIVVNDGSKDNGVTRETALSYGDRIRYFEKENGGVSSALNLGIKNMRGEYFSWLSHDDLYTPDKVKNQISRLRATNSFGAVAMCRADFIDKDGQFIRYTSNPITQETLLDNGAALTRLFNVGCFIGCNLLIPKEVFEKCGGFDEDLRYVQDFLMWIRCFSAGYDLLCTTDVDVHIRIHSGQLTQKGRNLFNKESVTLGGRVISNLAAISDKNNNYLYHYAAYCAKYNLTENVKECFRAAKKKDLFSIIQKTVLRVYSAYGSIRPFFRKLYYRLLKV